MWFKLHNFTWNLSDGLFFLAFNISAAIWGIYWPAKLSPARYTCKRLHDSLKQTIHQLYDILERLVKNCLKNIETELKAIIHVLCWIEMVMYIGDRLNIFICRKRITRSNRLINYMIHCSRFETIRAFTNKTYRIKHVHSATNHTDWFLSSHQSWHEMVHFPKTCHPYYDLNQYKFM